MKRFVRDEGSIGDLWFLDSKSGRSSLIFGSIWLTLTTRQNDSGTFAACPETVAFTVPFPTPFARMDTLYPRPMPSLFGRIPGFFGVDLLTVQARESPKIALRRPILSEPVDLADLVRRS
jgi:hypothetical protein